MYYESYKSLFKKKTRLQVNYDAGEVEIKEHDKKATLRKVVLHGVSGDTFGIKHDTGGVTIPLFQAKPKSKVHKGCDGIVWTKIGEESYVFVCELKSSEPRDNKWKFKMYNARALLEYLKDMTAPYELCCGCHATRIFVLFQGSGQKTAPMLTGIGSPQIERHELSGDVLLKVCNRTKVSIEKLIRHAS